MSSQPTTPTAESTTPATAGSPAAEPAAEPAASPAATALAATAPSVTGPPDTEAPRGVLGNQLTSWLRTVVPGLWATLVTWLVSFGLPASMTDWLGWLGNQVIVPIVLAIVYALLRRLEPGMPPWLTRLLIGSNRPPQYAAATGPAAKAA
jgi:hypothetical protein